MGIWSREYVCCAVPLYNSGIYAIMSQFAVVSIVAGVLAFAAPDIIAVAIPSWGPYLFGALAILVGCTQLLGFMGVYRERPQTFKTYYSLNMFLVAATLAVGVAFIALSAAHHSTAQNTCEGLFSADTADSTSQTVCNIWVWVQVGIMGLLWVLITICEIYFVVYAGIYASEQRLDHARYESVYSSAAEEIRQSGLYDQPRPSVQHNPSGLRNEYAYDDPRDEPEFPHEYRTQHAPAPANAGLYMPEEQPYRDDPYAQQHQQQGGGYYQDGYGGQYAPDHTQQGGYSHGQVEGYGAPVGGYEEKGYAKEQGYDEYAHHGQAPPGPQGGRWDQGGYR